MDFEAASGQYLTIPDTGHTGLDIIGDITIESWVKFESTLSSNGYRQIASKIDQTGDQTSYGLYYRYDSGQVLEYRASSGGNNATAGTVTYAWSGIAPETWYHVAVVHDVSEGDARLYLNGIEVAANTVSMPTSIYDGSADFRVGAAEDLGSSSGYFDGKIDDVRVWNVARTGAEIAANMNTELTGSEPGLAGYWKFDGSSLQDETSHNNDLTNVNSATFSTDIPFGDAPPPPPPPPTVQLKARKNTDESVTKSTTLQSDDDLKLTLAANTTYIVDGVIFASSVNASPDLKIQFAAQAGAQVILGYDDEQRGRVLGNAETSARIALQKSTPIPIHVHGTIQMGAEGGDVQLKWAQFTSKPAATTIHEGGYLRAEEL